MRPRLALVCALLACALGLLLRYETAIHEITGAASSCTISESVNCDAVQSSEYAKLLGMSVSLWAAAGSALLATLLVLVPRFGDGLLAIAGLLALINGLVSLAFLLISLLVLGVNCLYCNGIQFLSIVGAVVLVPIAWRARGAEWTRPALGAVGFAGSLALLFAVLLESYANGRTLLGQTKETGGGAAMRVEVSDAMLLGDPKRGAENSYVIYFDFGCPKCARCYSIAKKMLRNEPDRVHFFFKHWPLDRRCNAMLHRTVHEGACKAATAGTAAAQAGHSAQALEALFNMDKLFTRKRLRALGSRLGIDTAAWAEMLGSPEAADAVRRDVAEGNTLDFSGVPAVFRNGRREREMRLPRR